MKRLIGLIPIAVIFLYAGSQMYGQCEPDPSCEDLLEPGEICPRQLPDATVNVMYDKVITVIPPGEATLGENTIPIRFIVLDSIVNLPEGLTYAADADSLMADSLHCISITGTPTVAGEYPLTIYITPWIAMGETSFPGQQVPNDTSVVMTVNEPAGVDPSRYHEFQVLPNIPNPFSEVTRIGFFTPFDDRIELEVYNILGELMHSERQGVPPGEHYFGFDGHALQPGTYIYRVTNYKEVYTGKFIKARR
jgi:hypothetical protein